MCSKLLFYHHGGVQCQQYSKIPRQQDFLGGNFSQKLYKYGYTTLTLLPSDIVCHSGEPKASEELNSQRLDIVPTQPLVSFSRYVLLINPAK